MRYILAYFALMIGLSGVSLLLTGRALGFLLILVAAVLIYILVQMERARRRERRYGGLDDAIEGYERRFTGAERSLEERLPDDELDSPAMLELLSAYEGEPDDAQAVRDLYARLRQRFSDWREEFELLHEQNETGAFGLPEEFAQRYAELDRRLTQLLADVRALDERAEQMRELIDDPLDKVAESALKLEQAKATCARRFGNKIPEALRSKLSLAADKLADARSALSTGAERPLEAVRLAQEASALARSVESASAKT